MKIELTCPNCGGKNIFMKREGIAGNGDLNYLPGLGGFLYFAKLYPTICQDCGLVRFFTDEDAVTKLEAAGQWERLETFGEQDAPSNGGQCSSLL